MIPNLSLSLFERVLLNGTYKTPHMLDTQYRMHPEISEFPRTKFYGGLLKDGIDANARQLEGVISSPLYFWDTKGMQENNLLETSFVKMEVTLIRIVMRLVIFNRCYEH